MKKNNPYQNKILSAVQIREADRYTIENEPISSIDLMERAAMKCTEWIYEQFKLETSFTIFCGQGNNGGDGLAIARQLSDLGFKNILVQVLNFSQTESKDFIKNIKKLNSTENVQVEKLSQAKPNTNSDVIIDAIFGTGLNKPVRDTFASIIRKINEAKTTVISIDCPSGLFIDNHTPYKTDKIKANYTLSFQQVKLAYLLPDYGEYFGELITLNINLSKGFLQNIETKNFISNKHNLEFIKRKKFSHKGTYGHSLVVGGKKGMLGAVLLASKANLRSGTGLVTCHSISGSEDLIHQYCPELICSTDTNQSHVTTLPNLEKFSSICFGMGLGTNEDSKAVLRDILQSNIPAIIDADGLNLLAENPHLFGELNPNIVLTPHPKEFERLAGSSENSFDQLKKLREFSTNHNCYIALKGAHSCIATPDGICYFNTSGNNGLATAGSGDVLSGIISSFIAQKLPVEQAILNGVYLHGLSADLYAEQNCAESLIASDIIDFLPLAIKKAKSE